jgi:hypothetical protein
MYPLGSKGRPIIVKVSSKERAEKIAIIWVPVQKLQDTCK